MPLNLHRDCRQQLVEALAEGLPIVTTKNGMFVDRRSVFEGLFAAEKVIPTRGELKSRLVAYVDDFPVIDFISGVLAVALRERDKYLTDAPSLKLIELEGYTNVDDLANLLIELFESLPWYYTLSLRLPDDASQVLSKFVTELPLSGKMRLVRPRENFSNQFPLASPDEKSQKRIHGGGGLLIAPPDATWDENATYLQIRVEGFVDMYGSTMPASDAKALLKAFCGLGVAVRLFRIERTYGVAGLGFAAHKEEFYVHKAKDDGWEIDGKFDLEDHTSSAFKDVKFNDLDGKLDDEKKKIGWAVYQLRQMHNVFSSGDRGARLVRASQWFFDSYTGQDELLSFIQSMVVLEILLGENRPPEEIGLSELLRNRCAYLIGKSHRQRSELLQDFGKIYRVRSEIVHSGKSRLTPDERSLFYRLRWMCARVIQEEISLLEADRKKS